MAALEQIIDQHGAGEQGPCQECGSGFPCSTLIAAKRGLGVDGW